MMELTFPALLSPFWTTRGEVTVTSDNADDDLVGSARGEGTLSSY